MNKDHLTQRGILAHSHHHFTVLVEREVTSTNSVLKAMAGRGAPTGLVLFAQRQTEGRGRLGRSFYSPENGLYFSLLLRPGNQAIDALTVTTKAAVAVCRALSAFTEEEPCIKWVNDVYYHGRKVCGILTESATTSNGAVDYVILGVGVNLIAPANGFPAELSSIAGSLFDAEQEEGFYNKVAARLLDELETTLQSDDRAVLNEYRRLSFLIGRDVIVTEGEREYKASVSGIGDDYALILQTQDGVTVRLSSGEVSFSQWTGDKSIRLSP